MFRSCPEHISAEHRLAPKRCGESAFDSAPEHRVRALRLCRPGACSARWLSALLLAAWWGAGDAAAHAPPLGARVLLDGTERDAVIVTNRGLVFRNHATGAARLLCNEALLVNTSELPKLFVRGDGGLLVATSRGLRSTRDDGCTWTDVGGMANANISALASAPDAPRTVYVARYDGEAAGVLVSEDEGASWSRLRVTGEEEYVHSLVAPRAGQIHATVTHYGSQPPEHTLESSRDGGRQWSSVLLPLSSAEYAAVAGAADPTHPARLALYTVANSPGLDPGRVLVSSEEGDGFELALELPEVRAVSYDASGRLWVAARDGLYRSSAAGDFQRVSAGTELGCVDFAGDELLVCGHYAGIDPAAARPGVGRSRDGGLSFEALLDFSLVDAPVVCDRGSPTAQLCAQPWQDWQAELLQLEAGVDPYDGGGQWQLPPQTPVVPELMSPTAQPPQPAPEAAPAARGHGCELAPGEHRWGLTALFLLVGLWGWRRWAVSA